MTRCNLITLCLAMVGVVVGNVSAKRAGPRTVDPIIHDGVKYVVPHVNGRQGIVEARNARTNEKLWEVVAYTVTIDPKLEKDVQWVFIREMQVDDNAIIVTNEHNEQYSIDLKTRAVSKREVPEAGK